MQFAGNPARTQVQNSYTHNPQRVSHFAANAFQVIHHAQTTLKLKGFLCVLATWANAEGVCYPSVEKIAALAEVSIRTVERLKAQCVKLGLLEILTNASPVKTDLYRIVCLGGRPLQEILADRKKPRVTISAETGAKPKPK